MSTSIDEALRMRAEQLKETASLLALIPGGSELLQWFGSVPEFGDGEVVSLVLDRAGQSRLNVRLEHFGKMAVIGFELGPWIDVAVRGFSHQNVIGGLKLRRAGDRKIEPWEIGVGCEPGDIEIELEPCFGAYGCIRANISAITLESTTVPSG
jgi:hypothetical protein